MFDAELNFSSCDICKWQYSVLYYRDQSAKLALQSQMEREKITKGMKQAILSAVLNFKSDIVDISKGNNVMMEGLLSYVNLTNNRLRTFINILLIMT